MPFEAASDSDLTNGERKLVTARVFFKHLRRIRGWLKRCARRIIAPQFRKDRSDESILRDPRKIAFELKYRISVFQFRKDFHSPLDEFVVQYSARADLEAKCTHYLDVTAMRN
jgi:hypothetical protein